jgi:hypothetical protein
MLIFRRSNCIIAASDIVPLPHSVTIPEAAIIQLDLLKMSIVMLETFRGS